MNTSVTRASSKEAWMQRKDPSEACIWGSFTHGRTASTLLRSPDQWETGMGGGLPQSGLPGQPQPRRKPAVSLGAGLGCAKHPVRLPWPRRQREELRRGLGWFPKRGPSHLQSQGKPSLSWDLLTQGARPLTQRTPMGRPAGRGLSSGLSRCAAAVRSHSAVPASL